MPIILNTPIRRLTQTEFARVAYSVMGCIFQIHQEMGRFFDERIYKRELLYRHSGVQLEVPIEATHSTYKKLLYMDVLVDGGALFEFKTVQAINPRHRAQLLQYMLLADLGHGKLVNLRTESVEHEFINTTLSRADLIRFNVETRCWDDRLPGAPNFRETLTSVLRDWGTGLDVQPYKEALSYFLAGDANLLVDVEVKKQGNLLGHQKFRFAAPGVAFKLTSLPTPESDYEAQLRRLILHTDLEAIFWANITRETVTLQAVRIT